MAKYRRKQPEDIDAVQYIGEGNLNMAGDIPDWVVKALQDKTLEATNGRDPFILHRNNGDITISPGDYLYLDNNGIVCGCKAATFELLYELVVNGE